MGPLPDGGGSKTVRIDAETAHRIASKNNIKIPEHEVEDYVAMMRAAVNTAERVEALPDFLDSRLAPTPTWDDTRTYEKAERNDLNAWSHQTALAAKCVISKPMLSGREVVLKDNISLAGVPFTCGTFPELVYPDGQYPISPIDATVVKRLLSHGATITGTSTCENYCMSTMSYSSANGPVHNPWLRGYAAGGSTSGAASLLGLRLARQAGVPGLECAGDDVDMAVGADQGGSIRIPSSYCGVYGLKPTHGLVPYTGIVGTHPMIDHVGPMALDLEDIALLLQVMAGYDGMDGRMGPEAPLRADVFPYYDELVCFTSRDTNNLKKKPLRVGIIRESLATPCASTEVASVVRDAAYQHFTAAGAIVTEVSVPLHSLGLDIWTASCRPHFADLAIGARVPDMLAYQPPQWAPRWPPDQRMFDLMTVSSPAVLHVIFGQTLLNDRFGSGAQAKAHRHVFELSKAYDDVLEEGGFDVLVTPTAPTVAPPHPDMRPVNQGGSTVLEKANLVANTTRNVAPLNASGHPALSVPCGWAYAADGSSKLPVGMQLIGRRWDDIGVIKAARVFENGGGGLGSRDRLC
ncbi:unnamed protein product [Clonostachys rosea]|uniref:Amidase domain-containing protein n=1 Tax=Bionectria ochroleuca TaxID=29856 RepID=A0ABY6UFJ4_BIOOC|nr:unnamed protein product [Clonostachys rosea]